MTDTVLKSRKIAVFDLDGTLTYKDTYVLFLLFCLKSNPSRLPRLALMCVDFLSFKLKLRDNHWLKARFLNHVVGGLPKTVVLALGDEFSNRLRVTGFKPKALAELERLRSESYVLVLATASFDLYVEALFEALGFDFLICSTAAVDEKQHITGAIKGRNCLGVEKARRLELLMKAQGWGAIERAYSDDRVDLPMLKMAEQAFIVDPGVSTRNVAATHSYKVLDWR